VIFTWFPEIGILRLSRLRLDLSPHQLIGRVSRHSKTGSRAYVLLAKMSGPSSFTTPTSLVNLLATLPLTYDSIPSILASHKPISSPSHLPSQTLHRLLGRVNSAVLSKHAEGEGERRAACEIARIVVEQDEEGYVLMQWGKGWIGSCLSTLSVSSASRQFSFTTPRQALEARFTVPDRITVKLTCTNSTQPLRCRLSSCTSPS